MRIEAGDPAAVGVDILFNGQLCAPASVLMADDLTGEIEHIVGLGRYRYLTKRENGRVRFLRFPEGPTWA